MSVERLKIIWNNLWRKGTILGQSSQDPQHPSTDTQEDTKDMYWKTTSLGSPDYISLDVGEFEPAGKGTMNFDEGAKEPKVGEWLYGEGAQGKVVSVTKATGTWGVDATGSIVLEKCEGRFNDNEVIDGSIGGSSMLKVNEPDTGAGVDVIRNGEFENGTGGWGPGNATLTSVAGGKIGNCLKITENGGDGPYACQDRAVSPEKFYELSWSIKRGTEVDGFRIMIYDNSNGAWIYTPAYATPPVNWEDHTYIFRTPASCASIGIYLYSETSMGEGKYLYYDEVSLYELDEEDTEKEIDFFSLLDHNLSPTAQIKLIGAMDTAFSKAVKEITIPYHEENIHTFFTKVLRRYWKPEITDPDNPDGYIKGGIILAGKYYQPSRNPTKAQKRGDKVFSEVELTETLSKYGKEKETLEQAHLPFKGLTETDKDEIRKFMRECKIDYAFMIVYNTTNPNKDSVLYFFADQPADPQYNHYDSYSWEMNLLEVK